MSTTEKTTVGILAAATALLLIRNTKGTSGVGAAAYYTVRAHVLSTQYRNTSSYGNPSYWVTLETDDGQIITGYTAPNASIGYGINNSNLKNNFYNWTYSKGKRGIVFHYNDEY